MKTKVDSMYFQHDLERLCQGDVLRDFEDYLWGVVGGSKVKMMKRTTIYMVIMSQDCDLERDYANRMESENPDKNQDKFIQQILVCPAYPLAQFKEGTHLSELSELKMEKINSRTRWNLIKLNEIPRYHHLKRDKQLQVPDLVIDFKHFFTIQRDFVYEVRKRHYLATIDELFREELSQRFAYYLSRIGLPKINNEKNRKL